MAKNKSFKIAIVAALEREVRPLIKKSRRSLQEFDGRRYLFFENANIVIVCAGIGAQAARRATEAVIALYQPELVQSVGFAGALEPTMRVGNIIVPSRIVDASDGSRTEVCCGGGTLVTFGSIAGAEQKRKLAEAYSAQAVDMEAAVVAKVAERHGLQFRAIKVVSDTNGFEFPEMEHFASEGRFEEFSFALYAAVRPWLWAKTLELAINSRRASHALCRELSRFAQYTTKQVSSAPRLHLN